MADLEKYYLRVRAEERAALEERRQRIYAAVPALAELEEESRGLLSRVARKELTPAEGRALAAEHRRRRSSLLSDAGFSAEDLELQYRCQTCKDTGLLGESRRRPCSCRLLLQAELDPGVQINSRETFESFSEALFSDGEQLKKAQRVRAYCEKYAEALPRPEKPFLFMTGAAGLGKSYFANAIAYRALQKGIPVKRVTAYGFSDDMLSHIRGEHEGTSMYHGAPVLVLDDLGAEPMIRNITEECLYAVLNERLIRRLPTVICSNLNMAELAARYGERISSRLTDQGAVQMIRLEGSDLRRGKRPC